MKEKMEALRDALRMVAQGVINITEGHTTIEPDSSIHKAMTYLVASKEGETIPELIEAGMEASNCFLAEVGRNEALEKQLACAVELLNRVRFNLIKAYLQGPPGQTILGEIDDFLIKREEANKCQSKTS